MEECMLKKLTGWVVIFLLAFEQSGFAQIVTQLPMPAYLSSVSSTDVFRPARLRSVSFDAASGSFSVFVDMGDAGKADAAQLKDMTGRLVEYVKVGLRLPNDMFWVNLRPDTADDMIDPYLARTEIGRILLAADVQLKKDLAALTSPDTKSGRIYWEKLYSKAESLYGSEEDVVIPTLTRPWIVPGEIIVKQAPQGAYIHKAVMKVCLEQDWINGQQNKVFDPREGQINAYSSELIRELILPQLTREVNSAKRYAQLRQVYFSLILAQIIKASAGNKELLAIDSKNLSGVTSREAWSKDAFYQAYRSSFENGEYDRQQQVETRQGITIRRYFSGGAAFALAQSGQSPVLTVIKGDSIVPADASEGFSSEVALGLAGNAKNKELARKIYNAMSYEQRRLADENFVLYKRDGGIARGAKRLEEYPIMPRIMSRFSRLAGGEGFTLADKQEQEVFANVMSTAIDADSSRLIKMYESLDAKDLAVVTSRVFGHMIWQLEQTTDSKPLFLSAPELFVMFDKLFGKDVPIDDINYAAKMFAKLDLSQRNKMYEIRGISFDDRYLYLKDRSFAGKRVMDRVDFNLPAEVEIHVYKDAEDNVIKEEKFVKRITDVARLREALPGLLVILAQKPQYLLLGMHFEPKVVKIIHKGDEKPVQMKPEKTNLSTEKIYEKLVEMLPEEYKGKVRFMEKSVDANGLTEDAIAGISRMNSGEIIVLENVRNAKGEKGHDKAAKARAEAQDLNKTSKEKEALEAEAEKLDAKFEAFRAQLAALSDEYVVDAFGAVHREHASMMPAEGVAKVMGMLMQKETGELSKTFDPKHPMVAIFGGSKIEDKVAVMLAFLSVMNNQDTILIGGAMAYTFLRAQDLSIEMGKSLVGGESELALARKILSIAAERHIEILLPQDHWMAAELGADARESALVSEDVAVTPGLMGVDIGPKTQDDYVKALSSAKTVIWNGPMGVFEKKNGRFSDGTFSLAAEVSRLSLQGSDIIIGGGDTGSAITESGVNKDKIFVSTGGGATLEFLGAKGLLPVLNNLQKDGGAADEEEFNSEDGWYFDPRAGWVQEFRGGRPRDQRGVVRDGSGNEVDPWDLDGGRQIKEGSLEFHYDPARPFSKAELRDKIAKELNIPEFIIKHIQQSPLSHPGQEGEYRPGVALYDYMEPLTSNTDSWKVGTYTWNNNKLTLSELYDTLKKQYGTQDIQIVGYQEPGYIVVGGKNGRLLYNDGSSEYSVTFRYAVKDGGSLEKGSMFDLPRYSALKVKIMGPLLGGMAMLNLTRDEKVLLSEVARAGSMQDKTRAQEALKAAKRFDDSKTKQAPGQYGGIDFRALPVIQQPMPDMGGLKVAADAKELNAQLRDIRRALDAGKMPYEQLKAYAAYCARSGSSDNELEQVRKYIDSILRAEEDAAIATSAQMKEILACLG